MSGDEPYAAHDGALLLVLLLVCVITVLPLTVHGIKRLIRAGRRKETFTARSAAVLSWDATIAMYTWGLLHLFLLDDYARSQACRDSVGDKLSGYAPSFLPLHFGCRTSDGRVVEAVIPSYINPAVAVLGVCSLVLTGLAIAHHKKDTDT
ncbi:hypothetical protein OG873_27765 [Streptomyces violaceus]|uniref:hypothetical protein n=1 Tax=Streptomyces violaceus TaxID=1936 RepID=UPI002E2904F7|nr:hypothetical protein [Streptomyces violaceus]